MFELHLYRYNSALLDFLQNEPHAERPHVRRTLTPYKFNLISKGFESCAGENSSRRNQKTVIDALRFLKEDGPRLNSAQVEPRPHSSSACVYNTSELDFVGAGEDLTTARRKVYSRGSIVDPDSSLLSPPGSPEPPKEAYPAKDDRGGATKEHEGTRAAIEPASKVATKPRVPKSGVPVSTRKQDTGSSNCAAACNDVACFSCGTHQSPCWRPSWRPDLGRLCNSCGLRYRKTRIRCSSLKCRYVPSKTDLAELKAQRKWSCPQCERNLVID